MKDRFNRLAPDSPQLKLPSRRLRRSQTGHYGPYVHPSYRNGYPQPYLPNVQFPNFAQAPGPDPHSQIGLLEQIVEVLQNSTIAKERAKDALSKFWASYKTVSGEHDDDMLERCNENMDIVLIFAGLFSAVNTAFIIAMQPNPIDTTNLLLIQLTQITLNGSSATQPTIICPSTGYSSSKSWMQGLAYASLAFSLLAAYGAVMGKQWLGHYKTTRFGRGSLKDRCQQRHRKFQKLKTWRLEIVLRSFPVLLQISLLLFGMSLGATLWTQQWPISIFIIATTTVGGLCHAFTILVSLIWPDCPFQTPVSLAIQAVFGDFRARADFQHQDEDSAVSAVEWILETSTDPDVVRSVVEVMPTMSRLPDINLVSLCTEVRDMFKACFDQRGIPMQEDSALAYGKALIYFSSNYPDVRDMLRTTTQEWNLWQWWRALYLPQALEQCRILYRRMDNTDNPISKVHFQADARAALRMAVAAGVDEFAHPNDEKLIWNGKFMELNLPEVDWLLDCVEHFYNNNDIDAAGDALLLFSDMQEQSSSSIQGRLAPFLNAGRSHRFRHIALRAATQSLGFMRMNNLPCHHSFPHAVLNAICPLASNKRNRDHLQITKAIDLLNFTEWPESSDLAISPLAEIQLLVFLVLPAPKADDLTMYTHYCHALIRYMGADQPDDIRQFASNIVCSARHDLLMITAGADESLRDLVLSEICPALITTLFTYNKFSPYPMQQEDPFLPCLLLAFTLAKNSDWHPHLIRDGHIQEWITSTLMRSSHLAQRSFSPNYNYPTFNKVDEARHLFYLAGISLRISPPEQAASYFGTVTTTQWWNLMRGAWYIVESCSYDELDDGIESLPALVRGTEWHMPPNASKTDLESLNELLVKALDALGQQQMPDESVISAVAGLKSIVCGRLVISELEESERQSADDTESVASSHVPDPFIPPLP